MLDFNTNLQIHQKICKITLLTKKKKKKKKCYKYKYLTKYCAVVNRI